MIRLEIFTDTEGRVTAINPKLVTEVTAVSDKETLIDSGYTATTVMAPFHEVLRKLKGGIVDMNTPSEPLPVHKSKFTATQNTEQENSE